MNYATNLEQQTRELMEEIFPLTDQVNLLSEGSRYAYDSLLTSQFLNYGTKSNANKSNTNINTTCNNNNTCSPLPSKRQSHRESLRRQSGRMSHTGIWSHFRLDKHTQNHTVDSVSNCTKKAHRTREKIHKKKFGKIGKNLEKCRHKTRHFIQITHKNTMNTSMENLPHQ